MDVNQVLPEMLGKRRNRAISIILKVKERECDPFLTREQSQKLRKVILDQINDLVDFALDVYHSQDTGDVVLNDHYLEKLDKLYEVVVDGYAADQLPDRVGSR